jgi:hypothetical protein
MGKQYMSIEQLRGAVWTTWACASATLLVFEVQVVNHSPDGHVGHGLCDGDSGTVLRVY